MGNKSSKTILFLDIDGVLNNISTDIWLGNTKGIEPNLLNNLLHILHVTNAEIVLSSTWRLSKTKYNELLDIFSIYNIRILDSTTDLSINGLGDRVDEILYWLKYSKYKINNWIAIDDIDLLEMNPLMESNHFVHTI